MVTVLVETLVVSVSVSSRVSIQFNSGSYILIAYFYFAVYMYRVPVAVLDGNQNQVLC